MHQRIAETAVLLNLASALSFAKRRRWRARAGQVGPTCYASSARSAPRGWRRLGLAAGARMEPPSAETGDTGGAAHGSPPVAVPSRRSPSPPRSGRNSPIKGGSSTRIKALHFAAAEAREEEVRGAHDPSPQRQAMARR
jgi:hypothetical protein